MPTYEYACSVCDERLEVVQKFTDEPLTVCTSCGGPLRKLFSPVGIVFKGSGFYRTDSRNGSVPAKDKKPEPASSASADTKPSGDARSKPGETKAAPKTETSTASKSTDKAKVA